MGEQNITNQYEMLKIVAEQNQEFILEYGYGHHAGVQGGEW